MKITLTLKTNDEDDLIDAMRELILASGIDPESAPEILYRCFRDEFDLPVDLVYAQFL